MRTQAAPWPSDALTHAFTTIRTSDAHPGRTADWDAQPRQGYLFRPGTEQVYFASRKAYNRAIGKSRRRWSSGFVLYAGRKRAERLPIWLTLSRSTPEHLVRGRRILLSMHLMKMTSLACSTVGGAI